MRYAIDACVTRQLERALRNNGASAVWLGEQPAIPDPEILAGSVTLNSVLITTDTDFGEHVFKHGRSAIGVVLIRCSTAQPEQVDSLALRILALPGGGRGAFTTLDADGERIRPLP